MNLYSAIL